MTELLSPPRLTLDPQRDDQHLGPPEITVLVPARNEERTIVACVDSVLRQCGADDQVVVVDNGSTDATARLVAEYAQRDPRVQLVRQPIPSIPRTLNAGLAVARGQWTVRVDAHSRLDDGYIARAVALLRTGRYVGVGGRKDAVAQTPTGRAIAAVLGSPFAVGGSVYHHGTSEQEVDHVPFGAYPTELVRQLGGWDETAATNEDFELDQRLRAHGVLWFDPALRIEWHCRERVGDLYRQYRRYGAGKPSVAVRHPGSVRPRHLAPPALVLWLAGTGLLATRRPGLAAAAVAPYAVAVIGASAAILRGADPEAAPLAVPASLVAMQAGWGVGFWEGAARMLRDRVRARRTS